MVRSAMFWRRLQAQFAAVDEQQQQQQQQQQQLSDDLLLEATTIKHVAQQHVFKVAKDHHACYSGPVRSC